VLLETPGIFRLLSTPRTESYPVTNVYKNGTIRIQKGMVSERVNILRITPFNSIKRPIKYNLGGKWHTIEYESKR
jgi:hypothetical protein